MSNLIKAGRQGQHAVSHFDFSVIEPLGTAETPPLEEEESAEQASPPPVDPQEEVEALLRTRMLEAERRAQEMEEEGYQKGYAQGQTDGLEYGRKSSLLVKEHLEKLFSDLQHLPSQVMHDYRDWLVTTCMSLTRHIVGRELATDAGQLTRLIESLLDEAEKEHALTIYLNPHDLALLEKHTAVPQSSEQSQRNFALKPDPRLERGGCRLESEVQLIDASLETQFAMMEQALTGEGADPDALPG